MSRVGIVVGAFALLSLTAPPAGAPRVWPPTLSLEDNGLLTT